MSHINIPAPRLQRLIRVADLRAQGKKAAEIAGILKVHPQTVSDDYSILRAHTRAELERRLIALHRAKRPAPKRTRGACVYTVVRADKVHGCGRECDGQYCDEHKRAVTPGAGEYVPMTAHVYLRESGGRCK
ncbi:MAG: hypothetical protein C0421_05815 [Hyphomonas sp.]|uniref:helix-turn-helix transcriptional regulator n=1 Tax=Hyphomonas sp. TaxID=87 RepID=UPI0025BDD5B8|nr:helix-turn-helix transcriptional regulator [Hyphomonas sp.]MBA4338343.1 hypothetical protein [Hyphomonas sp.]